MANRRSLATISQKLAKASGSGGLLASKQKLPGVAASIKYAHRNKLLPPSIQNEMMLRAQTAGLGVPIIPRQPSLNALESQRRFPVRRIFCVGSNYMDHIKEMGNVAKTDEPFFFTKPSDAAVDASNTRTSIPYPQATSDFQHEVELVVAIGKPGRDVSPKVAMQYVYGVAVGVDLTRRDLQAAAKTRGLPWDSSKGFDCSAPIGAITPIMRAALTEKDYKANEMAARREWKASRELETKREQGDFVPLKDRTIRLTVDGKIKQDAKLGDMLYGIPELISALSKLYTVEPGDIIFTGTPAGVGKLEPGQVVEATIQGLTPCTFRIREPLTPTVVPDVL